MNSPFLRKFSLVYLFPDKIEHSERPKELCFQLPVTLGLDVFAIQSNFLAGGVASRFDSFIMGSFLKFLGMMEIFSANNHQLSEFR